MQTKKTLSTTFNFITARGDTMLFIPFINFKPLLKLTTYAFLLIAINACEQSAETPAKDLSKVQVNATTDQITSSDASTLTDQQIEQLHQQLLTLDSHVDISREYMREPAFDPGKKTNMKVDFDKMRRGGMDAVVFIVYVEQKKRDQAGYDAAYKAAIKKFDAIHKMTDDVYSDQIELALTPADVYRINQQGKLVAMIGVENGYTLAKNINRLDEFYQRGARYLGLTHSGHNDICDSSAAKKSLGDAQVEHGGMSEFGQRVVARMNQLGMMIDLSHASDKCVEDALKYSKAPIIASHSGARALHSHPRNLPDNLIKAIADKGGVVQLVAYSGFIKDDPARDAAYKAMKVEIAKKYHAEKFDYKYHEHTPEYAAGMVKLNQDYPLASISQYVDQIEHVIKIAGIDHVGISSDFDGGGELSDWQDTSQSLNITKELIKRGYNKQQLQKIWGQNFLTSWALIQKSKSLSKD